MVGGSFSPNSVAMYESTIKPKTNIRKSRRKKKSITKKSVLKMLAVMDQQTAGPSNTSVSDAPRTPESSAQNDEFLQTGRTGRRNALPDILNHHSLVTTADLPSKLDSLTTNESKDASNNTSGAGPSSSS